MAAHSFQGHVMPPSLRPNFQSFFAWRGGTWVWREVCAGGCPLRTRNTTRCSSNACCNHGRASTTHLLVVVCCCVAAPLLGKYRQPNLRTTDTRHSRGACGVRAAALLAPRTLTCADPSAVGVQRSSPAAAAAVGVCCCCCCCRCRRHPAGAATTCCCRRDLRACAASRSNEGCALHTCRDNAAGWHTLGIARCAVALHRRPATRNAPAAADLGNAAAGASCCRATGAGRLVQLHVPNRCRCCCMCWWALTPDLGMLLPSVAAIALDWGLEGAGGGGNARK
jgi:hypothetical protein